MVPYQVHHRAGDDVAVPANKTEKKWKPAPAKWAPGAALDVVVDGDVGMIIPGSYGSRGNGGFDKDSTRVISPETGTKVYD